MDCKHAMIFDFEDMNVEFRGTGNFSDDLAHLGLADVQQRMEQASFLDP